MKIKTIDGKLVKITKNELIYNALNKLTDLCNQVDAVYLARISNSDGILINSKDLQKIIEEYGKECI